MATYTFDDGSTIDTNTGASTDAPAGNLLSDYASNFAPSNLTPGATSFLDVLKYGFGRVVDYKTASLQAQNTTPQYAPQQVYATGGGVNLGTVLVLGAVGLALVVALGGK